MIRASSMAPRKNEHLSSHVSAQKNEKMQEKCTARDDTSSSSSAALRDGGNSSLLFRTCGIYGKQLIPRDHSTCSQPEDTRRLVPSVVRRQAHAPANVLKCDNSSCTSVTSDVWIQLASRFELSGVRLICCNHKIGQRMCRTRCNSGRNDHNQRNSRNKLPLSPDRDTTRPPTK